MGEQQLGGHGPGEVGEVGRQTDEQVVHAEDSDENAVTNRRQATHSVAMQDVERVTKIGIGGAFSLMGEHNWMRRDVLIKKRLDFDDAYWHRAGTILRVPPAVHTPA